MGGRPTVSALLKDKGVSKISGDVLEQRIENEIKLKGNSDKLKPSSDMCKGAKKIFKFIVSELKESEIFGNVDKFIIEQTANTLYWYKELERLKGEKIGDFDEFKEISKLQKQYGDSLPRLYSELSLTPQSRAKIGAINVKADEENQDPLLNALNGQGKGGFGV